MTVDASLLCIRDDVVASLNGEFVKLLSSSSDSNSSRRRLRLFGASTLGDNHFDNELGNIFETCVFTFPIIDCKQKTQTQFLLNNLFQRTTDSFRELN